MIYIYITTPFPHTNTFRAHAQSALEESRDQEDNATLVDLVQPHRTTTSCSYSNRDSLGFQVSDQHKAGHICELKGKKLKLFTRFVTYLLYSVPESIFCKITNH